jgi:hypothetical protein
MRTLEQINNIKQYFSNPYSVENFVSADDIVELISIYDRCNKTIKNTGPVTVDVNNLLNEPVLQRLLEGIKTEIGSFEFAAGLFFKTDYPHIIHNDDTFELPNTVYKAITIPLAVEGLGIPKLCFFDQCYFHGPAKFFNGDADIPTYYNQQVYDYRNVDGIVDSPFIDEYRYFTHLKPNWLHGLSLQSAIDWIPTQAIIFDSVRLHCASDFRSLGIKSKLGLSIFTKRL